MEIKVEHEPDPQKVQSALCNREINVNKHSNYAMLLILSHFLTADKGNIKI